MCSGLSVLPYMIIQFTVLTTEMIQETCKLYSETKRFHSTIFQFLTAIYATEQR